MNAKYTVIAKGVTTKRKRDEGASHNLDRKRKHGVLGMHWIK